MKWTRRPFAAQGDRRDVRYFALLPVRCCDGSVRWLEWVHARQVFRGRWFLDCFYGEARPGLRVHLFPKLDSRRLRPRQQLALTLGLPVLILVGIEALRFFVPVPFLSEFIALLPRLSSTSFLGVVLGGMLVRRLFASRCDHTTAFDAFTPGRNAEAIISEIGFERFMNVAGSVVDSDVDAAGMPRRLLRVSLPAGAIAAVQVQCPSTKQIRLIRVPPGTPSCREAVAWTFRMDPRAYNPSQET
jgi:hypothetical protein